jgi:PKD repeat protein
VNNSVGFDSYEWWLDNTLVSTDKNLEIIISNAGQYNVKLVGRYKTLSDMLLHHLILNPTNPSPQIITGLYTLTSGSLGKYLWFRDGERLSESEQTITPKLSGSYTLQIETNGCPSLSSSPINFAPKALSFHLPDTVCLGANFEAKNSSYGFTHYVWRVNGIVVSDEYEFTHQISQNGVHTVSLTGAFETHRDSVSHSLDVVSASVDLGPDATAVPHEMIKLQPDNRFEEYHWSDGSEADALWIDPDTLAPGVHVIWISVVNSYSCTATDQVEITVLPVITSIHEKSGSAIVIFPNPAKNEILNIHFAEKPLGNVSVVIRNQMSQEVKRILFESADNSLPVPLSGVEPGLYYFEVTDGHVTQVYRVLKM